MVTIPQEIIAEIAEKGESHGIDVDALFDACRAITVKYNVPDDRYEETVNMILHGDPDEINGFAEMQTQLAMALSPNAENHTN